MNGYVRYGSDEVHEILRIMQVSDDGAVCMTRYGSSVSVYWRDSLPEPAPKIGEVWVGTRINSVWSFDYQIKGDSYNAMRYAITLDARSCIGRERVVADDIIGIGVDEVFLTVAADNNVMWDSEIAYDYGLESYGDHVGELLDRFSAEGIAVTFVVSCELWTSASNKKYRQAVLTDGIPDYSSTKRLSFVAAREPMRELINELYEKYGNSIHGICLSDFGMDGPGCDFNERNIEAYRDENGYVPDSTYFDGSDFAKSIEWVSWNAEQQRRFLDRVSDGLANFSISAILPKEHTDPLFSGRMTGRVSTSIADDFPTYGWASVGIPIRYARKSDDSLALRSFELAVAYAKRTAQGATPVYFISIRDVDDYEGVFSILAKYNAGTVLLDGYEDWRMLSDSDVIRLDDAMGKYRVTAKQTTDFIGVLASSNSRDFSCRSERENKEWLMRLDTLCCHILDKTPHRLSVIFDGDLPESVSGISTLVIYEASAISDESVDAINGMVEKGGCVIFGVAGENDENGIARSELPFVDAFGQSVYAQRKTYEGELRLAEGATDVKDSVFGFSDSVSGLSPVYQSAATSFSGGDNCIAPVFINGRASYVALSAGDNDSLLDLAADLVVYSIGRD